MERRFSVTIEISNNEETLALALQGARKAISSLGLKVIDCKPIKSTRTNRQNDALHLFFQQLSEVLNESGFDMRHLIREEVEISWTPYTVKTHLWKPLQKALLGKKSTTQLDKSTEINLIYDNLNRILVERTGGEVQIPMFPSIETMFDNQ